MGFIRVMSSSPSTIWPGATSPAACIRGSKRASPRAESAPFTCCTRSISNYRKNNIIIFATSSHSGDLALLSRALTDTRPRRVQDWKACATGCLGEGRRWEDGGRGCATAGAGKPVPAAATGAAAAGARGLWLGWCTAAGGGDAGRNCMGDADAGCSAGCCQHKVRMQQPALWSQPSNPSMRRSYSLRAGIPRC